MSLVWMLRYMVELYHIDVMGEVSMIASHSNFHRDGQMQQLVQIL